MDEVSFAKKLIELLQALKDEKNDVERRKRAMSGIVFFALMAGDTPKGANVILKNIPMAVLEAAYVHAL